MKSDAYFVRLFSDTIDNKTAALVRAIAGQHDRFATDWIGREGSLALKLEARRDGDTGWAIDRLVYNDVTARVEKKIEAHAGLCFFDALYHCARFQATELNPDSDREIVAVPDMQWQDIVSYRAAA